METLQFISKLFPNFFSISSNSFSFKKKQMPIWSDFEIKHLASGSSHIICFESLNDLNIPVHVKCILWKNNFSLTKQIMYTTDRNCISFTYILLFFTYDSIKFIEYHIFSDLFTEKTFMKLMTFGTNTSCDNSDIVHPTSHFMKAWHR